MNYIKIEGKDHPVKFGLSTIQKFAVKNGMKSAEAFDAWYTEIQKNGLEAIGDVAELLKLGFDRGAAKEGKPSTITADDIMDLVLEDPAQFTALQKVLESSLKSNIPEAPAEEGKDELPGKKK